MADSITALEPVGYEALVRTFELAVHRHYRKSFIAARARATDVIDGQERHIYPPPYRPDGSMGGQLEFAIKNEGISLGILKAAFARIGKKELARYVSSRPTSQYTRRIWFFYEWITGARLDLPDLTVGNYVDALDADEYFTGPSRRSSRHRVNNNIPGVPVFCPLVRRTERLASLQEKNLPEKARHAIAEVAPSILERATEYLYMKETRSSYAIERETPDQKRTLRFVETLRRAPSYERIDKAELIELQRAIVDSRFAAADYRTNQNYIGETRLDGSQRVHFVSPKPEDLAELMSGMLECDQKLWAVSVDPIVHAAIISFGFVFLHPFDDGNGRIHRFLIHQILSRAGFTPTGLIFPVSAVMLANRNAYDSALESFSRSLMSLVEFDIDDDGVLSVKNDTTDFYRYFDATNLAEYLYGVVEETLEREFLQELRFIAKHDKAKAEMRDVVDLPNRELNLFFKVAFENRGRIGKGKRKRFFESLTDEEVSALEDVIRRVMFEVPGEEENAASTKALTRDIQEKPTNSKAGRTPRLKSSVIKAKARKRDRKRK